MKNNVIRLACLLLTLLLATAVFAGCSPKNPVTKTDVTNTDVVSLVEDVIVDIEDLGAPFTIEKLNDKDIVILTPGENGAVVMTVAENTTLEVFLSVVKAEEGHAVKVFNADGTELTDTKAIIAKDMKFEVYADGKAEAEVSYVIDVISEAKIEETIKEQEKVDETNSNILLSNPSVAPSSTSTNPSAPSTTSSSTPTQPGRTIDITLFSVWNTKYASTDAVGKAFQSTMNTMSNKQGINTTVESLDPNTAADLITKETMAGRPSADVYEVPLATCRNVAKSRAAANLFRSKTLNRSLVDNGGTDAVTFGSNCYGVAINGNAGAATAIIYNKELLQKYAPEYDPIKLYKAGKWDFDTFRAIAKLCTVDTDGDGKVDIHGVTSNTNLIGQAITSNAGGTALMKNGRVEATMCNNEGIAALEWCKELFKTDRSWKYFADIKDSVSAFSAGKVAMFASNLHHYAQISMGAEFDYDFVHVPKGPDQDNYIDAVYNASLYMVSKGKESRLDDIGEWINGIASISSKLTNAECQQLARNGFSNDSISIYRFIMNNMQADYSTGAFSGEVASKVDSSVTNASLSPAKVMVAIKSQAQKECDDFYANMYN